MNDLKNVIYLSNEDYETLVTTGTVTIDGVTLTYSEDNVYITPEKIASQSEDGLMSATDKVKLDEIESGAQVNVQSDWNVTDTSSDAYIKNKPTIPTDTNQKIKAGSVTFGNNDVVDIVAGSNTTVTGLASGTGAPKITISATDTGATSIETTGSGNVVNSASYDASARKITLSKGVTALTSHQSIKTLKTDNTTAQTVSSSEAIAGSGTINLHKVAKTGTYSDLIGKPTIPSVSDATITVKQTGISDQTFTLNGSATTITLADTNTHYTNYLDIKTKISDTETSVVKFIQSGDKTLKLIQGSNVTLTPDATNGTITIASTDTNTWRPIGTGATDAAAGNHAHGNITNTGTITSTAVTSATGVLVYDSSNKVQRATAANTRSIIGAGTYSKPSTGIPVGDLDSATQAAIVRATTAYVKPSGGIPDSDLANAPVKLYEHNLILRIDNFSPGTGSSYCISLKLINATSTAYTGGSELFTELYNAGYTSSTSFITASGSCVVGSAAATPQYTGNVIGLYCTGTTTFATIMYVTTGSLSGTNFTIANKANSFSTSTCGGPSTYPTVTDFVRVLN